MTTAAKKPNLRTLAQQGTQWRIAADIPVYQVKAGVGYPRGVNDWDVIETIKAGETLEVASKKSTTWGVQNGKTLAYDGLWLHLKRVSDGKTWCIQFSDFNKHPEMLTSAQPVPVYVLRDTATGQWYSGNQTDWSRDNPGSGYISTAQFEDKFTKARKFKRLADVRAHMLIVNGYYEGLPDTGSLPEWMRWDGKLEWPATMEIVEVDKVTKNEMQTWETSEHLAKMWRLRALTLNYGSSVRAMYKKLEDKNQLGEYPALVVFRTVNPDRWWDYEMDPTEVDAIKTIAKTMGKGNTVLIKHQANVCLACINEGTAWAATQFYQGALTPHVISLNTLLECVPTETSVEQTRKHEAPESLELPDLDLGM